MPIVLESQKLVVARHVVDLSPHPVIVRSPRSDVLDAVRKEYGLRFRYHLSRPGEEAPTPPPVAGGGSGGFGGCYVVADEELLPSDAAGRRVSVPLHHQSSSGGGGADGTPADAADTDAAAPPPSEAPPPLSDPQRRCVPESERRGEGRVSLPTSFR